MGVIRSSHGDIVLTPSLPQGWNGHLLPGSQPYSYEGPLGAFTIQEFYNKGFSICYAVINTLQKIKFFWKEEHLLRFQYLLHGMLRYKGNNEKIIRLRAGHLNVVWAPGRETCAEFNKGEFEIFQIAFQPELVKELVPDFPPAKFFAPERSNQWIGKERQKDLYDILNAPYNSSVLPFFYGIKIREHLLACLLYNSGRTGKYSDGELEKIYEIDRMILENPGQHYSMKELAELALMNEGKLVEMFTDIIGVSMFERYKEAKLQKARRYLLETDVRVNQLYKTAGYDSYSGFVRAFKDHFKLTPHKYRKKYRPF
jgi:AraC-like DNA-binding protein